MGGTTDLMARNSSLQNVPDFIEKSSEGHEHFQQGDFSVAMLAIAQDLTPQLKEENDSYIDGLKRNDLFNTFSQEIYKQPLKAIVLVSYPPRGVEFRSREEGGGIIDMNVPLNDERMMFGPNGEKPKATLFYDYILYLPDYSDIVVLSMKSTDIKMAKNLNKQIRDRQRPIYSGLYIVEVILKRKGDNTWGGYKVNGRSEEGWQWVTDEKLYNALKEQHAYYREQTLGEEHYAQQQSAGDPSEGTPEGGGEEEVPF